MKSTTILVAVVASLVGGVVGALAFSQLAPGDEPTTVTAPVATEVEGYDDSALRADTRRNTDAINDVQGELLRLQDRVDELQDERKALLEENTKLKQHTNETVDVEVVTKPGETDTPRSTSPELEAEVDRAVAAALEKQAEQERAEWEAATRKETEGWMGDARDNITEKLDAKLTLTQFQRDRIGEIMGNTTQRVADLMVSGAGKGDDGREQWDTIWRETTEAIRNELGTAQQTTYDELVGERGIVSIAWDSK